MSENSSSPQSNTVKFGLSELEEDAEESDAKDYFDFDQTLQTIKEAEALSTRPLKSDGTPNNSYSSFGSNSSNSIAQKSSTESFSSHDWHQNGSRLSRKSKQDTFDSSSSGSFPASSSTSGFETDCSRSSSDQLYDAIDQGRAFPQHNLQDSSILRIEDQITTRQNNPVFSGKTTQIAAYAKSSLMNDGICVIDNFLSASLSEEILSEVRTLYESGTFRDGQLVLETENSRKIREDKILWLSGEESGSKSIGNLLSVLDLLMAVLAPQIQKNILYHTKAMVAYYPSTGAKYVKHVDNPNNDGRCLTSIYYINKDWHSEVDGGVLQIYPEGTQVVAEVEPKFNRLLLFWSDRRNPHEVLPAFRTRFAVTVWYFDENERLGPHNMHQESISCV